MIQEGRGDTIAPSPPTALRSANFDSNQVKRTEIQPSSPAPNLPSSGTKGGGGYLTGQTCLRDRDRRLARSVPREGGRYRRPLALPSSCERRDLLPPHNFEPSAYG